MAEFGDSMRRSGGQMGLASRMDASSLVLGCPRAAGALPLEETERGTLKSLFRATASVFPSIRKHEVCMRQRPLNPHHTQSIKRQTHSIAIEWRSGALRMRVSGWG